MNTNNEEAKNKKTEPMPSRFDLAVPEIDAVDPAKVDRTGKPLRAVDRPEVLAALDALVTQCAEGDEEYLSTYDGKLVRDMALTAMKLISDGRNTGELKLMTAAFKELRYAYNVFADRPGMRISIFGSARTPEDDPDYRSCVEFSRLMAEQNWSVITGAGDGIMKAGHEGPGAASSWGLAIRLPFETTANSVITGDEKLINFRYFFTRKLMFVSQCQAVAVFPGGFGTQDEIFEALTLIQTGKSGMVPIVLVESEEGTYWKHWENYVRRSLLGTKMISPEDLNLFFITRDPAEAVAHVVKFYKNYHSSRYVRDTLVLRIKNRLQDGDVERLNEEFSSLVKSGKIEQRGPLEVEEEFLDLPRIVFHHTRYNIGLIRRMIDRINEFEPADTTDLHPSEVY